MSEQPDQLNTSSTSDQQLGQVAGQAHAEIARLHEHAQAELESLPGGEGKHSLPGGEPTQGEGSSSV